MARIGDNAFRQYVDGQDRLTAREYTAERELIRLSINDLDDKIQRTEGIREEFSNTVNEVQAVKGEITQAMNEVSETIPTLATKPELNNVNTRLEETTKKTDTWIDVKDYEYLKVAVSGGFDWLPVFQKAYSEAKVNKKPINIPAETFYLSNSWVIDSSDISIIGRGNFYTGTILSAKGGKYPVIKLTGGTGDSGFIRRLMISNLKVHGTLYAYKTIDLWLDNVYVEAGYNHGLHIVNGWSFKFQGCQFQWNTGYGVYFDSAPDVAFAEVNGITMLSPRIEANTLGGIGTSVGTKLQSLNIFGGIIEGQMAGWGIDIPYARAVKIDGLYFEANPSGNARFGSDVTTVDGLSMTGILNHGYGSPRPLVGIHCVNVLGGSIQGSHTGFTGSPVVVESASNVEVKGHETDVKSVNIKGKPRDGFHKMNIARNGGFESWNGSSSCYNWLPYTGSPVLTKETTIVNSGLSSCKMTYSAGNACGIAQRFGHFIEKLKGRKLYIGVMAKTDALNRLRIRVSDGVQANRTSFSHNGNNEWQFIGLPYTVSNNAQVLDVIIEFTSGEQIVTAYLDDFVLIVDGEFSGDDVASSPADYLTSLAGTVNVNTPVTGQTYYYADVTHNMDNAKYTVQLTPNQNTSVWIGNKTGSKFTVYASVVSAVDYAIRI